MKYIKHKIIVAVTGASGSIYANNLIDKFDIYHSQIDEVAIVFSKNAKDVWRHELELPLDTKILNYTAHVYENDNFNSPIASGSSDFDTMIIVPCSMGMLSRIACGTSNDLISRAADVMLKERKRLIIVPRETPLNFIHLENMRTLTLAGAVICPAMPSFYSKPRSISQLVNTVVNRILDLSDIKIKTFRWG